MKQLPFSGLNAFLILYLSLSKDGWFYRFGFLEDSLPVSVFKFKEQCIPSIKYNKNNNI